MLSRTEQSLRYYLVCIFNLEELFSLLEVERHLVKFKLETIQGGGSRNVRGNAYLSKNNMA